MNYIDAVIDRYGSMTTRTTRRNALHEWTHLLTVKSFPTHIFHIIFGKIDVFLSVY